MLTLCKFNSMAHPSLPNAPIPWDFVSLNRNNHMYMTSSSKDVIRFLGSFLLYSIADEWPALQKWWAPSWHWQSVERAVSSFSKATHMKAVSRKQSSYTNRVTSDRTRRWYKFSQADFYTPNSRRRECLLPNRSCSTFDLEREKTNKQTRK